MSASFTERLAERQAAESSARAEHQAELEALERDWAERRANLRERHNRALDELAAPFQREQEQIEAAFWRHAFGVLPSLVSAFLEAETRVAAVALADAWKQTTARARHDLGQTLGIRELSYFLADWVVERHPQAASVFGSERGWWPELWGTAGIPVDEAKLERALASDDGAAIKLALLQLAATLERVGKLGQSPDDRGAERWHAMRQRGAELLSEAEIVRRREAESIARHEANEDEIRRARAGEVIEGRSAKWYEAVRLLDPNVFGPLKGVARRIRGVVSSGA